MYEVKLEQFSGPLDKLLELIEARKLEVTTVSLAEVTEDFLAFLKQEGGEIHPGILADFLVVAAKLVLIKSKMLLPDLTLTEEEEGDIKDLEARLLIYREFAARGGAASANLLKRWDRKQIAVARPLFLGLAGTSLFYPGPTLTRENLVNAASRLLAELEALMPTTSNVKRILISLEEKIQELMERCTEAVAHSFKKISACAIHFVNKCNSGNFVSFHLAIYSNRL